MKLKSIIIGLILSLSIFALASNGHSAWTVSPSSINFGDVPVGTSKTVVLTITNTGAVQSMVMSVTSSIPEVTTNFVGEVPLNPGEIMTLMVTFKPTARGNYSGELVIASNDPANPYVVVTFTGTSSYATGIDVSPTSIDFGTIPVGTSKEEVVRVGNKGSSNLNVTITVTAGTPFSVSKESFTLRPGQVETIIVTFNPTQRGVYTGALTVFSDDKNTPKVVVSLRGDTGAEFGLAFFPTIMNFGYVELNTSYERMLRLYNVSSNIINVSLSIQNISGSAFSFPSSLITSFSMIPGEMRQIPVKFTPTAIFNYSGLLYIATNTGTASISLLGTGSETGTVGLEPQNPPPSSGSVGGGGCSIAGAKQTSFVDFVLMISPLLLIMLKKFYRKRI